MTVFISYPIATRDTISARGPKSIRLIWVSRVDMGYDMEIVISLSVYHTLSFLQVYVLDIVSGVQILRLRVIFFTVETETQDCD